jgi:hypothetical protein
LQSLAVIDWDSLISTISRIVSDTSPDELIAVYQNWMKRLRWAIKNRGNYYKNQQKKRIGDSNFETRVLMESCHLRRPSWRTTGVNEMNLFSQMQKSCQMAWRRGSLGSMWQYDFESCVNDETFQTLLVLWEPHDHPRCPFDVQQNDVNGRLDGTATVCSVETDGNIDASQDWSMLNKWLPMPALPRDAFE